MCFFLFLLFSDLLLFFFYLFLASVTASSSPSASLSRASFVSLPLTLFFTIAHRLALKCADTLTTDCWHFVSLLSSVEPTLYNLDNWHSSLSLFFSLYMRSLVLDDGYGAVRNFYMRGPCHTSFHNKFCLFILVSFFIIIHDTDIAFSLQDMEPAQLSFLSRLYQYIPTPTTAASIKYLFIQSASLS